LNITPFCPGPTIKNELKIRMSTSITIAIFLIILRICLLSQGFPVSHGFFSAIVNTPHKNQMIIIAYLNVVANWFFAA